MKTLRIFTITVYLLFISFSTSADMNSFDVLTQSQLPNCEGKNSKVWTNCQGIFQFKNGDRYEGEFKDGKFTGWGTLLRLSNDQYYGDVYKGQFLNGLRHGLGLYNPAKSDAVKEGVWGSGKFLREQKIYLEDSNNSMSKIYSDKSEVETQGWKIDRPFYDDHPFTFGKYKVPKVKP